jgi:hypothetical protein
MPYDNTYNRMVADDIMKLNKKYIDHEKSMEGSGMSGGFLGALAGMLLPQIIGSVGKLFGNGMSGGAGCAGCPDDVAECVCGDANKEELEGRGYGSTGGFAEGTMMDTGFDRTIGAGMSAGVKKYKKRKSAVGCGRSGGGVSGGMMFSNIREKMAQNKIKPGNTKGIYELSGIKNIVDAEKLKQGGRKSKSTTNQYFDGVDAYANRIERDAKGIAKDAYLIKDVSAVGRADLAKNEKKPRKMKGAGIISSLGIPLISNIAGMFGLGRSGGGGSGGGLSGGAELGLPPAMAGEGMAKKGRKSKMGKGMSGGRQLVPVANMKASYMAGLGRSGGGGSGGGGSGGGRSGGGVSGGKASGVKRGDIVKRVMAERGLKMIEASKYVKEHNLY